MSADASPKRSWVCPNTCLYRVLISSRAAIVSYAGSSFTFCRATWMTASSSCSVVIWSNSTISSSLQSWVVRSIASSRPRAAAEMDWEIS